MDNFQISYPTVENDIETEIISSDDMARMQVDMMHNVINEDTTGLDRDVSPSDSESSVDFDLTTSAHVEEECSQPSKSLGASQRKQSSIPAQLTENFSSLPLRNTSAQICSSGVETASESQNAPTAIVLPRSTVLHSRNPSVNLEAIVKRLRQRSPAGPVIYQNSKQKTSTDNIEAGNSANSNGGEAAPISLPIMQFLTSSSSAPPKPVMSRTTVAVVKSITKLPIHPNPSTTVFSYPLSFDKSCPEPKLATQKSSRDDTFSRILSGRHSEEKDIARKPCRCKRSSCLKLYCDCFNTGAMCLDDCSCVDCFNNDAHLEQRLDAVKAIVSRNALAFKPKVRSELKADGSVNKMHAKGCRCRKSNCLKKYCECFMGKTFCGEFCRCAECKNSSDNSEHPDRTFSAQEPADREPDSDNLTEAPKLLGGPAREIPQLNRTQRIPLRNPFPYYSMVQDKHGKIRMKAKVGPFEAQKLIQREARWKSHRATNGAITQQKPIKTFTRRPVSLTSGGNSGKIVMKKDPPVCIDLRRSSDHNS